MATRKKEPEFNEFDEDETLVDDAPEDGFELIEDQDTKPEDRRRDPLRRPV